MIETQGVKMRTKRAQNNSAIPHSFFTTRQSAEWVAACSPGYRLARLKERLMAPELVREFIRAFQKKINRAAAEREQQVRADRLFPLNTEHARQRRVR